MILHVDMDAFFAAIEQRDNPELAGRPLVVSGQTKRSVVSTASYEARKFGIRSAMPLYQAVQLCPDLIVQPGHRHKYAQDSQKIMSILKGFSPLVEQVSIDEAFLDIRGCGKLFGDPITLAQGIKTAIRDQVGLSCSIGLAPVRFLAKIASDMEKPDGLTIIEKADMDRVIQTLPILKVPGVGQKAGKLLADLRITTLGQILKFDAAFLEHKLGKMGTRLIELAQGIDNTPVETVCQRKSISSETTLLEDISDPTEIRNEILGHCQRVGRDLRRRGWACRQVTLKLKFADFSQITRGKKTDDFISSSKSIFNEALTLFNRLLIKKKIRLIGVGVSDFRPLDAPVQLALIEDAKAICERQWVQVDHAVDAVLDKFGSGMIQKASLRTGQPKHVKEADMDERSSVKVRITGRVQGVFFRAHTRDEAKAKGLEGYVRNCADGAVEAVFQGKKASVDAMVQWCKKGSPHAKVTGVTLEVADPQPFTGFSIRY